MDLIQCISPGCNHRPGDSDVERDLGELGVADCPRHGRWYFAPQDWIRERGSDVPKPWPASEEAF